MATEDKGSIPRGFSHVLVEDSEKLEIELERHREFVRWLEPHVSKPIGSYSVMDLNVFYAEAREKIAALR